MTTRLASTFAALHAQNRAGLIAYVMGADPDTETSFDVARALIANGADVLELGFPFSDPMADGPAIQAAGERALKAGGGLAATLELCARLRAEHPTTPVILMGYLNPVEQMGPAAFAKAAAGAGADGAIIVDLPPEEDAEVRGLLAAEGLALIRFATPTTDDARLKAVLQGAAGFVYYISVAGITGQKIAPQEASRAAALRLKAATDLPVAVGFGVRDEASAAAIAQSADAVVVGSALVEVVAAEAAAGRTGAALAKAVGEKAAALSKAVHAARAQA